jgi:hypothetical protein
MSSMSFPRFSKVRLVPEPIHHDGWSGYPSDNSLWIVDGYEDGWLHVHSPASDYRLPLPPGRYKEWPDVGAVMLRDLWLLRCPNAHVLNGREWLRVRPRYLGL